MHGSNESQSMYVSHQMTFVLCHFGICLCDLIMEEIREEKVLDYYYQKLEQKEEERYSLVKVHCCSMDC